MNKLAILISMLLLAACSDTMTFGVLVRYHHSDEPAWKGGGACHLPGEQEFTSSMTLEKGSPSGDLWVEEEASPGDDVYVIRAYVATEYQGETTIAKSPRMLAERTYDHEFGEGAQHDAFEFEFEGIKWAVDVVGIPADGECSSMTPEEIRELTQNPPEVTQ